MAESGFAAPAVGDIDGRRAMWAPIIGAASTAQPIPADVTTSEHYATADDGAQNKMRRYVKDGAAPGPAVLFFHGSGYVIGHIDLFDGPVSRYVSASGVSFLSVINHHNDTSWDRETIGVTAKHATQAPARR
jgi:acetyl esterase/lipase